MSNYTIILRDMVGEFLDSGVEFQPTDIADQFTERHGDLLLSNAKHNLRRDLVREIKNMLKGFTEDDLTNGQLTIPGIELPTAIAIPAETASGFVYKNSLNCTWDDIQGGIAVRKRHVTDASRKLDQMVASAEMLRSEMAYDRTITVREAIQRMQPPQAA